MKKSVSFAVVILVALSWTCKSQEKAVSQEPLKPGIVVLHSGGLHGYISYSTSRPPAEAQYNMGMGFYAAVWPLIDRPLANFQIGLPSAWITPDNSDNKDKPLAPVGTLARDHWPHRLWSSCVRVRRGGVLGLRQSDAEQDRRQQRHRSPPARANPTRALPSR